MAEDAGIQSIENQCQETFRILMRAGIDFDYGDEWILSEHGSAKNGKLQVGNCTYEKILLSGVETIKESTWKLLYDFEEQGGKLVIAGKIPERIHTQLDERMERITQKATKVPFEEEKIKEACRPEDPLYILENHGKNIFLQSYQKEKQITFLLLNMDRENKEENIELTVGEGKLEQLDARTGTISPVIAQKNSNSAGADRQKLCFDLEPGEERIYV